MLTPGPDNAITDVPGIEVGHDSDHEALTGVTVVLARQGAVAGVDVRGSAPGTRETDLLDPENLVQQVQAIVLSGGSAFGLRSADGVMSYLEEQGLGQQVAPDKVVPIVPAAVIFDLDIGSWSVRPDAAVGYRAAAAAVTGPVPNGNVGAGTGARAGGLKAGVGSASSVFGDGLTVAALAVVNSAGRPFDPVTGELYGLHSGMGSEFAAIASPAASGYRGEADPAYGRLFGGSASVARNTTIGVVATNARLDKAQARKLAQQAHDGIARSIRPAHTMFDGDTIFALATGEHEPGGPAGLARLGGVAADTFARAIVRAVLSAASAGGLLSYCATFPMACERSAS